MKSIDDFKVGDKVIVWKKQTQRTDNYIEYSGEVTTIKKDIHCIKIKFKEDKKDVLKWFFTDLQISVKGTPKEYPIDCDNMYCYK